jgi:hypothetical protein
VNHARVSRPLPNSDPGRPLRLAILLASLIGLAVLGLGVGGSLQSSGTSHLRAHGATGRIVATVARHRIPLVVRQQLALPHPGGAAAIKVTGTTYLLGGLHPGSGRRPVPDRSVYRLAGNGSLVRVAALPLPIAGPTLAKVGPRVYAIGGRLASGRPSTLVEEYDIATEKSVIAAKLPQPVSDAAAVTMDGYVYLVGGLRGGTPSKEIVRFDPWRDSVASVGKLPLRVSGGEGATARLRRAYVVGAVSPVAGRLNLAVSLSRRNF